MNDLDKMSKLIRELEAVVESLKRKERDAKRKVVMHNPNVGFITQDGLNTWRAATDQEVISHFRFGDDE